MKVLIAIPCMDQVPAQFAQCLACLKMPEESQIALQIGSLVYTSRNTLARHAMKEGFDYVLWLDSDMTFEADLFYRMLQVMNDNDIKMLTGVYFRRRHPYSPVLFDKMEPKGKGWNYTEFTELPDGLFEVGSCGFGCVLMATEVLLDVQMKHGYLFHPMNDGGEDISFCWRVRECGHKIICDPSIKCGHVGSIIVTESLYKQYQLLTGDEN